MLEEQYGEKQSSRTTQDVLVPLAVPACVYWKIFGVIGVFFILLKVELAQQLAGFGHRVIHSSIVKTLIRTIDLSNA